jgi:hypothetical protein
MLEICGYYLSLMSILFDSQQSACSLNYLKPDVYYGPTYRLLEFQTLRILRTKCVDGYHVIHRINSGCCRKQY